MTTQPRSPGSPGSPAGSGPGSPAGSAPGSAPGSPALLAPAQAAILLDQVIYEQVLECVDLDALYRLEQSLTMIIADFERDADRAADVAKAIIDRALLRVPDDVRSYLHAFAGPPFDDCELFDVEEAGREPGRRARGAGAAGQRPTARLRS
ncbi:MAG TPA: hypothetical protein VFK02_29360 [Kofleriaceae bacterium]|nr:hypothetical protein [Kofleriaceae bacterium]